MGFVPNTNTEGLASGGYGSNSGGTYSADPATGAGGGGGGLLGGGGDNRAPANMPYTPGAPLPQWAQNKIDSGMAARNLSWNSNPAMLNSPGSIAAAQASAQQRLTDRMTRRVSQNGIGDPHQRQNDAAAQRGQIQANQQQYEQQLMASNDPSRIAPYLESMYGTEAAAARMDPAARQWALQSWQERLQKAIAFQEQTGMDQSKEIAQAQNAITVYGGASGGNINDGYLPGRA